MSGQMMTPDPAGMAAADPANPQSWNRYTYVMNNPLNATDPFGLECVWDDGSFDSSDDPNTGSIGGCTGAGGTYFDHSTFSAGGGQDWSPNPDQNIASLLDTVGPDQWVGNDTGYGVTDTPVSQVTVNGTTDQVDYVDWGFSNSDIPLTPQQQTIFTLTYLRSMHDLGCFFGSSGGGAAGATAFKLGQPVPGSKPFTMPGSSLGTSTLSDGLRGVLPDLPFSVPTPVGGPGTGVPFRFASTTSLGGALARYAPFAGAAAMGYSAYKLNSCLSSTPSGH